MPAQTQEHLTQKAAEQLSARLLDPLNTAISTFEGIFPGISAKVTTVVDLDKLRTALSAEVAESIKTSMSQGTGDSLRGALMKVTELKRLLLSLEIAQAKELMGERMLDQDAEIFHGRDLGEIPALPANILEILNSRCELANDGRRVAETHRLILVPASIDGSPTSLGALSNFERSLGKVQGPSFKRCFDTYEGYWSSEYPIMFDRLERSTWALIYQHEAPGSLSQFATEQFEALKEFKNYEAAKVLVLACAIVFNYHENREIIFAGRDFRCQEVSKPGQGIGVRISGLEFRILMPTLDDLNTHSADLCGLAITRKLSF